MWTRHGECNGCGHCCQTFKRDVEVRMVGHVTDLPFYRARGFVPQTVGGRDALVLMGWMSAPCPQHQDNACAIYDDRPATCRAFPLVPADIVDTPCSYWFTTGTHTAGGQGSPHPVTVAQLLEMEHGRD